MRLAVAFGVLLAHVLALPAIAESLQTSYYSSTSTSLESLASGAPGEATLLYYLESRGPDRPSLAVNLTRATAASEAVAEVFHAPSGVAYVPVEIFGERVDVDAGPPIIRMTAPDGWWRRGQVTNYNLNVEILGGINALWGPSSWMGRVAPGEPAVDIRVGDEDGDGVPDWDLRRLLRFPRDGYYHVNYAERMCQEELQMDLGVTPEFPFVVRPTITADGQVSGNSGFELRNGSLRPPIVVDWGEARVLRFSEIVTVRHQSCSYGLYSTKQLQEEEVSDLDFETPFAFYDLRGDRTGFPDLIIRSAYSAAGDSPASRARLGLQEGTRYSWRLNDRPDWDLHFDYKVELAGRHGYDAVTEIAGGLATITAPDHASLPDWLMSREWPLVTFVSTEGSQYRSSEGIYEWSTRAVGPNYLRGSSAGLDRDDADGSSKRGVDDLFTDIRSGLRGEYRLGPADQVQLYLSPLTNRLHLTGAQAGVHSLGAAGKLYSKNVVPDDYLDTWYLTGPSKSQRLVQLGDYLFYSDGEAVHLKRGPFPMATEVVTPPTDAASWQAFRDDVADRVAQRRPADDLGTWFDAFVGPVETLVGAVLRDVWYADERIRMLVEVVSPSDTGVSGGSLLGSLPAGENLMEYDLRTRVWAHRQVEEATLTATLERRRLAAYDAALLRVEVSNTGGIDVRGPGALTVGETVVATWDKIRIPSGDATQATTTWTPPAPGTYDATLRIGDRQVALGTIVVEAPERIGVVAGLAASTSQLGIVATLVLLALLLTVGLRSFGSLE